MYQYVLSFIIVVLIVALVFRTVLHLLDRLPANAGNSLWFLIPAIFFSIIIITLAKPDFFMMHTHKNGLPFPETDML